MFRDIVARIFRNLNYRLLYVDSWPVQKFLKASILLSTVFYKRWLKKARAGEIVEITLDKDIKMKVDTSKAMGAAFYWTGFHEFNEWRFLNQHLKPDMVFVDVGANQGEYALFAAKRLTNGIVLAYEPVEHFLQQLTENISRNGYGNIRVFPYGLSNAPKHLPIYMGETGAGENEGLATVFPSNDRKRFIQDIDLKVFDDVVPELKLQRMDFMKIDVEGSELDVLKGSYKTIKHFRPWIMLEVSDITYETAGYSVGDIIKFFEPLKYSCFAIGKGGTLKKITTIPSFCNLVFAPN